jgi:hypothetical protein
MPPLRCFSLGLLLLLSGCGYHAAGASPHLPQGVRVLAVPVFRNQTQAFATEAAMTEAVVREFTERTSLKVIPGESVANADAILYGTILTETVAPLTYNAQTGQSSGFLVTVRMAVRLVDRDNRVLFEDRDYLFRQPYQSSADLPSFLQEDPAAVDRLSRDFARTLVADLIESF